LILLNVHLLSHFLILRGVTDKMSPTIRVKCNLKVCNAKKKARLAKPVIAYHEGLSKN
jgi:hypothetical protein